MPQYIQLLQFMLQYQAKILRIDQQIFDDLTLFYQLFKIKISLVERICLTTLPFHKKQQAITEFQKIIQKERDLIWKYTSLKNSMQRFKMIFCRYFTRLIEILEVESKKTGLKNLSIYISYIQTLQGLIYTAFSVARYEHFNLLLKINDIDQRYLDKVLKILVIFQKTSPSLPLTEEWKSWNKNQTCGVQLLVTLPDLKDLKCPFNQKKQKTNIYLNNIASCLNLEQDDTKDRLKVIKGNSRVAFQEQYQRNYYIAQEINNYGKLHSRHIFKRVQRREKKIKIIEKTQGIRRRLNTVASIQSTEYEYNQPQHFTRSLGASKFRSQNISRSIINVQQHAKTIQIEKVHNTKSSCERTLYYNKVDICFAIQKKQCMDPKLQLSMNFGNKKNTLRLLRKKNISQSIQISIEGTKLDKVIYKPYCTNQLNV